MTNLLITELRRLDSLKQANYTDKESCQYRYELFLNDKCNIPFKWTTSQKEKVVQWRDLTGPEKHRLFSTIDIPELFPEIPNNTLVGYGKTSMSYQKEYRRKIQYQRTSKKQLSHGYHCILQYIKPKM